MSKRKSYASHNIRDSFMRGAKASLRRIYRRALEEGYSQDEVIKECARVFTGDYVNTAAGVWDRLTEGDRRELYGYRDALHDIHQDALEFRYLINGKWYTGAEVCDRKDGTDPVRDIPSPCTNGHFVYKRQSTANTRYGVWF